MEPSSKPERARKGPTEDAFGNRLHSVAGQAVNRTFGGLALGFSGSAPDDVPDEVAYRSPIFQPGANLGPPYLDELRMTTTCVPTLVGPRTGDPRTKNLQQVTKLPQVEAVFSPAPPKASHIPVKAPGKPSNSVGSGDASCVDRGKISECPGEDNPDGSKNMFLFFGQPPKQGPGYCPPIFETSEAEVFEYFEAHNVEGLMEYFLTLLCINLPDDPFEYIQGVSADLIKSRRNKTVAEKMDVVFEPSHVLAMFSIFDKGDTKVVSVEQYKNAMESMGLSRFNPQPIGFSENSITEDVFFDEATKALNLYMKSFTDV